MTDKLNDYKILEKKTYYKKGHRGARDLSMALLIIH